MIRYVNAKDFAAIPHLETSMLMRRHRNGIAFSTDKPNVIMGSNGSGKSALLKALALKTLSFYTGYSALDNNYVYGRDADKCWTELSGWKREYAYLQGLQCDMEMGTALYYRPGAIPGDECGVVHAMMMGYHNEAREYAELTEKKSSGQQSQALQAKIHDALAGRLAGMRCTYANWKYDSKPQPPQDSRGYTGMEQYQAKAEMLRAIHVDVPADAPLLVLLDEPEQSLDAKAEAMLWKRIENTKPKHAQVIVATHSWYPVLHPEAFNIIEAAPGYVAKLRKMI